MQEPVEDDFDRKLLEHAGPRAYRDLPTEPGFDSARFIDCVAQLARHTPSNAVYRHRGFDEAFGRLRYGVELDAIAVLVAESGCAKSLLLGVLADEMQHDGTARKLISLF